MKTKKVYFTILGKLPIKTEVYNLKSECGFSPEAAKQ